MATLTETVAQQIAIINYVSARKDFEGLQDSITYGTDWEASRARRALAPAREVLHAAISAADTWGVLAEARRMFR